MKFISALLLASTCSGSTQYAIDWYTINGGGGPSSGGAYTLHGTIGQYDAATSSGGRYTLHGGFWSAFAVVQTEGAPTLRILRNGGNVTLAWPNSASAFQLQQSPSLSAPNWTDVNTAPGIVGDERQVSQEVAPGTRFFRLRQP